MAYILENWASIERMQNFKKTSPFVSLLWQITVEKALRHVLLVNSGSSNSYISVGTCFLTYMDLLIS